MWRAATMTSQPCATKPSAIRASAAVGRRSRQARTAVKSSTKSR
jgi:hypothetical protein